MTEKTIQTISAREIASNRVVGARRERPQVVLRTTMYLHRFAETLQSR